MKVKDLLKSLSDYDPEEEIVMKNLYANPLEPSYCMSKIRVYRWGDRIIIDGYDRQPFNSLGRWKS